LKNDITNIFRALIFALLAKIAAAIDW